MIKEMLNETKVFVGPMTKNVVDAVVDYANEYQQYIGLIPSRRQIDHSSGYVNNWTTKTFSEYVRNRSKFIILQRDHGGPDQSNISDDGLESFKIDAQYFDIIHIDVWKKYKDLPNAINKTAECIEYCYNINPNILFEIGTEEAIRKLHVDEITTFLKEIKSRLSSSLFKNIVYSVIQSGTAISGTQNVGKFDYDRLQKMIAITNAFGVKQKEHNGDQLTFDQIKLRFKTGLSAINIAPEFGMMESSVLLEILNQQEVEHLFECCYLSNRWQKWVPEGYDPISNKTELIKIAGHYVISNSSIQEIMAKYPEISNLVKIKVYNKLNGILL